MAQSVFTSQTPVLTNLSDQPVSYTLGMRFSCAVNGQATGGRFYAATGAYPAADVIMGLFDATTQVELARGSIAGASVVNGAWNVVAFTVSVAITAGTEYYVAYRTPYPYVATSGFFGTLTNGDLTATGGAFFDSAVVPAPDLTFPDTTSTAAYFADIIVETSETIIPAGIAVPVALGTPTLSQAASVNPGGLTIPVTLGAPTLSQGQSVSPAGLTIPVTLGAPTLSTMAQVIEPAGITVPVTLGAPTLTQSNPPNPLGPDLALAIGRKALECLCDAVANLSPAPEHCRFQVGLEGFAGFDQFINECCEGVAYVAMGDVYPSFTSFPDADINRQAAQKCNFVSWAVEFRMGVITCAPTGTDTRPPTDAEWNAAALYDYAVANALRRAACCLRSSFTSSLIGLALPDDLDDMSSVIGRQTVLAPSGGCVERYVPVTVQMPNCEVC